ncbi:MAG: hypothetical protein KC561_11380, partial [Myxococcales bacterium]|nr:hypothetical protein [Myxococcales bacterium]
MFSYFNEKSLITGLAVLLAACGPDTQPAAPEDAESVDVQSQDLSEELDRQDALEEVSSLTDLTTAELDVGEVIQSTEGYLVPTYVRPGTSFFDSPWPSDLRRTQGGNPELSDFPRASSGLVHTYVNYFERDVTGFSTMPVVYVSFSHDISDIPLPTPAETLLEDSPIQLIRIDSDHCGETVAVEVVARAGGSRFIPAPILAASPVHGLVLEPATSYALIIKRTFGLGSHIGQNEDQGGLLGTYSPAGYRDDLSSGRLETLSTCLTELGLAEDVAVATSFTTQDPIQELEQLVAFATSDSVSLSDALNWAIDQDYTVQDSYTTWTGDLPMPIFQAGDSPYNSQGGFRYDSDDNPILQRWENAPIILTVPDGPGPFPVLIWASGAGHRLRGHVRQPLFQALLDSGIAIAKFVPQFEDERTVPGADLDLHTYNYLNPESARAVLRQQVIESAYFVRWVTNA